MVRLLRNSITVIHNLEHPFFFFFFKSWLNPLGICVGRFRVTSTLVPLKHPPLAHGHDCENTKHSDNSRSGS